MKTVEIFCDWDKNVASIAIIRTPKTGGYSKREYKRGRFAHSSNRVAELLGKTKLVYHTRYLPGGGFAYSYRDESDYHQGFVVNACSRCAVFIETRTRSGYRTEHLSG